MRMLGLVKRGRSSNCDVYLVSFGFHVPIPIDVVLEYNLFLLPSLKDYVPVGKHWILCDLSSRKYKVTTGYFLEYSRLYLQRLCSPVKTSYVMADFSSGVSV